MNYSEVYIKVYVANLKKRTDRLTHIKREVRNKNEFDVKYVNAIEDKIGDLGLWKTLRHCVQSAKDNNEDVIVFCEDDHIFTDNYNKEFLMKNIVVGNSYNAELLIGGSTGGFNVTVPITQHLIWVDHYYSNNFLVIYRRFFDHILSKLDFNPLVKVDNTLAALAVAKFILYPYISVQKNFKYSDVTPYNNLYPEQIAQRFENAEKRLKIVSDIYLHYQQFKQ
jgi:glycosyl transferase family 25